MKITTRAPAMIGCATVTLFLLMIGGCHQPQEDARQRPPLVLVTHIDADTKAQRVLTGVIAARVQSDLGFRVGGKVVERLVDSGHSVQRGQVLMRIDTTDLKLATAARQSAVEAARVRASQTAADEQRLRALAARGLVPANLHEQSKTTADAAAADLRAAQAQADVAKNEASYSVLVADADGVVAQTLAEPGQVVAAGQTVLRLAHAGRREAVVNLSETLRPALGSTAQARLYAAEGSPITATLRQLSESADPLTRTFEARYVLEDRASKAPLGSTVTLTLPDTRASAAPKVPLSAVTDRGQGPGVWVIAPSSETTATVAWRPITLAALDDENVTLIAGLNSGDRFVTMGAHLLRDGDPVRLAAPASASTP